MHEALIRDFVFADDCALAVHSESELQCLATCFSTAAKAYSLTVSIQKSVVMHQPAPATCGTEPSISIDDATLKNVENFTYLGSCLSSDASLDKEIAIHLSKASNSFGHLRSRVWNEQGLKEETKIAVYRAVVLSSLLYRCGSWMCYRRHHKKLDQFHLHCLRKILGITWMDKVSNQDVLHNADLPGVEALITKAQLRWSGHVMRMEDSHLPKQVFCSELAIGKRKQGGQQKRYKDYLKRSLLACNIPIPGWESLAKDHLAWRQETQNGITAFEVKCLQDLDVKRSIRKERAHNSSSGIACLVYGRTCASEFGLRLHLRRH